MSFYKYLTQFNLVPIVIISQDPSCEAWALLILAALCILYSHGQGKENLRYFEYSYGKG
jgi:hypothetical protein